MLANITQKEQTKKHVVFWASLDSTAITAAVPT